MEDSNFHLPCGETCHTGKRERESPRKSFTVCCPETVHYQAALYKAEVLQGGKKKICLADRMRKPAAACIYGRALLGAHFTARLLELINSGGEEKGGQAGAGYLIGAIHVRILTLRLCAATFQGVFQMPWSFPSSQPDAVMHSQLRLTGRLPTHLSEDDSLKIAPLPAVTSDIQ